MMTPTFGGQHAKDQLEHTFLERFQGCLKLDTGAANKPIALV